MLSDKTFILVYVLRCGIFPEMPLGAICKLTIVKVLYIEKENMVDLV